MGLIENNLEYPPAEQRPGIEHSGKDFRPDSESVLRRVV